MFKKLLFLLLPLAVCCGKEIYVDINASAPGKGTQSSPFTAIQQAADAVEPGDTVIIKPGVYFETVRLKRFGTEDAPVTFKADKIRKRRVIITGADKDIRTKKNKWKLHDKKSSTYVAAPVSGQPVRVLYSEVDLFPYKSLKALMTFEVKPGVPGPRHGFYYQKSSKKLFVRLRPDGKYGSTDPNEHTMAVSAPREAHEAPEQLPDSRSYNFGILGKPHQKLNVIIDGITFETPARKAVYVSGDNVTVRNCLFLGCLAGGVSGRYIGEDKSSRIDNASSNITVEQCEWHNFPIYDDVAELIDIVKTGKFVIKNPQDQRFHYWVHKNPTNGALIYYETGIIRNIGKNWTLRKCYVHDVFDGIANMNWADNTIIEDNLFEKCIDNAIETENHAKNCHIRRNKCVDIFQSLSYQPIGGTPWAGPIYIYQNLICRTQNNIFKTGSSSTFKIGIPAKQIKNRHNAKRADMKNYKWGDITTPGIYVFNNTFIEPGIRLIGDLDGPNQKLRNIHFINNIAVNSALSYNLRKPGNGGVKTYDFVNNKFVCESTAYPLFDAVKSQVTRKPGDVLPGWKENNFVPAEFTPAVSDAKLPAQFKYVGALQSADDKIAENAGIAEEDVAEAAPAPVKKAAVKRPAAKKKSAENLKTVSGKSVRLEWNTLNDTATPWEVRFNAAKLEKIAGFPSGCAYAVKAAGNGETIIPATSIALPEKDDVLLRFTVPAGTRELYLVPAEGKNQPVDSSEVDNLLAGILDSAANWKTKNTKVAKTDAGILISADKVGPVTAYADVQIPSDVQGRYAALDLDVQSKSPLAYGTFIRVAQLDKNNRILSESVTDPRWISHMRPTGVKSCYRAKGVIHPQAAKLRLEITLSTKDSNYDNFGRLIKNRAATLAKLEVSRAAIRCANEMVFPRYNDANFSEGVSGKDGDHALVLHKSTAFTHVTTSHATWGEDKQIRNQQEWFWPTEDGTVECFFKPGDVKKKVTLFDAANIRNSINGQYQPVRNNLLTLTWDPEKKRGSIMIKDAKNKKHEGVFKFDMLKDQWNHVACQWGEKDGVSVYLNGKKVFAKKGNVVPVDIKKVKHPSVWLPHNFSVGTTVVFARGRQLRHDKVPKFEGSIDLLRVSSKQRYKGDFTPEKEFKNDFHTRALYNFDRSFSGVSGGGIGKMLGTYDSPSHILSSNIECNGETAAYFPSEIADGLHPDKVLCRLNYPVLPVVQEARAARRIVQKKALMRPGKSFDLDLKSVPYMDYVEIGPVKSTVKHPIVITDGEIDCRSFGDITRSLGVSKLSELERIYRIFNFMIYSSDYYTSHQVDFPADSDSAIRSTGMALTMLNIYCGFNCGPLNDMLANIFTCSAGYPATRTFGFGHSFQQVYYGGKNRLYDLSAQRFFPTESLEEAGSLEDAEFAPNVLRAFRGDTFGPDHYIRLTTKMKVLQEPGFQQRVAYDLRPGEKMRIYFNNAGSFNDLQAFMFKDYFNNIVPVKDYSEAPENIAAVVEADKVLRSKSRFKIYKSSRVFPHYSNAFLMFDGKVDRKNPAFRKITDSSFCYRIELPYTVTGAIYKAVSGGKAVPLSISTDGGKSFHKLALDDDGAARLDYEVRARHGYWLRIEKPISEVDNFSAVTAMMLNSRVQTGKLKKGKNTVRYEADTDTDVPVTIQYRVNDGEILFAGDAYSGSIPGNERQLTVVEPGKERLIKVTGASADAKVITFGPVNAQFKDSTLRITAGNIEKPAFGAVILDDGGRRKELTCLVASDTRLVTAVDGITPGAAVKMMQPRGERLQQSLAVYNSKGKAKVNFAPLAGGKYNVWMLLRIQNVGSRSPAARFTASNGTVIEVGKTVNHGSDLYKAQFGRGTFGRFHWDYAMKLTRGNFFYDVPHSYVLPAGCSSLDMDVVRGIKYEFAGLLIIPACSREFQTEMTKVLSGLNCEPWKIAADGVPLFLIK